MTGTPSAHPVFPALRRYGPAAATSLLIAALSLLPARFFAVAAQRLPPLPSSDKLVHALLYAALTLALLHALPAAAGRRLAEAFRVALASSLYGLAMEIGQKLITRSRSMDALDACANAVGALAAALLCAALQHRSKKETP